jgi:hypothetical protein
MPANLRFLLVLPFVCACGDVIALADNVVVTPDRIDLIGWRTTAQLQVTLVDQDRRTDLTRETEWAWQGPPNIVSIDDRRQITAEADGQGTLVLAIRGKSQSIPVRVSGVSQPPPIDFEADVQPILTKFSCNAGACHGKQRGQNGFQLSLLGFDSQFDFDALTKESRGRRTSATVPEASLLLLKPINAVPHGGGRRLEKDGRGFRVLHDWIRSGMPRSVPNTPALAGIVVEPSEAILFRGGQQQLRVTARYADGSTRDVTSLAAYQSNESAVAGVDGRGLITAGSILGDTSVMARYLGQIAVCSVLMPHPNPAPADAYVNLPQRNEIDGLVWKRLKKLGITPSEPAAEHTVLRRLYLDIIGRGPTADEARRYLNDTASDRRARLIDELLQSPEYAEHWACKWTDLLRPNPYHVGIKATLNYDAWIRDSFRKNKPFDQFVRELITAQGSTFRHGNVTLYRDRRAPDELTTLVSQIFLGVRLECAKCHHHPFEVYGQDDFYSFAAYFAKIGRKGTGISAPISGSEEFVFAGTGGVVTHPLTGAVMTPRPLFGEAPSVEGLDDPREALAAWITADANPYFAKTAANRVWADLMGRGLVEPVDDLRGTNPPTNPELLEALARHLREHKYDLKSLVRWIANSHVYALSSVPNERNAADHRNFSRHYRQRLRAEVLYDTVAEAIGVREPFSAAPPETRSKELWTVRTESQFLDAFGRQDPNQDPPCERNTEPTIVQALHLMNSNQLYGRIASDESRAAKLAASDKSPEEIVNDMYLSIYGRFPTSEELSYGMTAYLAEGANRRQATEDLLWALINTPEFVFKD